MAKKIIWTEKDVERIRQMSIQLSKLSKTTRNRPPVELPDIASPEGYIARTRVGGIPAAIVDEGTGTGNGCAGTDIVLGYAFCDVYEAILDDVATGAGDEVFKLVEVPDFFHRVFNVSTTDVPGNTWIWINKDTSGRFFVTEIYPCLGMTGTGTGSTTGTGTTGTGTGSTTGTGTGTGTDVVPTGTGTDVIPTGTGTSSCATIPGVDFDALPISTSPDYVLGIKDGCLVRVPVGNCDATGTG